MTMRARVRILIMLVLLAGALAACSDDSDTSEDAADTTEAGSEDAASEDAGSDGSDEDLPDPCGLLTTDDLNTATGLEFGEGAVNDTMSGPGRAVCDWTSDSPFATAQTLLFADGDFEMNRETAAEISGEPLDVDVPGADQAYQTPEGSIVAMTVGDLFVQVSYIPSGPGNVNEVTLQLAETAVGNL
jgi:hypothetical protein